MYMYRLGGKPLPNDSSYDGLDLPWTSEENCYFLPPYETNCCTDNTNATDRRGRMLGTMQA